MPTGYTALIENGKVKTAKDFAILCLRNFGVCMPLRDEALSVESVKNFNPSENIYPDYYDSLVKSSEKSLEELESMDPEEFRNSEIDRCKKEISRLKLALAKANKTNSMLAHILNGLDTWKLDDDMTQVKEFAIQQLGISIEPVDHYESSIRRMKEQIKRLKTDEGLQEEINSLKDHYRDSVERYKKESEEVHERSAKSKDFYDRFMKSVETIKEDADV